MQSDILCLTETWLTKCDSPENFLVTGNNEFAVKNCESLGGVVMIQFRKICASMKNITKFDDAFFMELSKFGTVFR